MLKRILCFTVFITLLATVVYADDWKAVVDPYDGGVFAVGKSCEPQQGEVFVTVLYPGADPDRLSVDLDTISYLKALNTDMYGNFGLQYTLNDIKSGVYPVSVNDGCDFEGHKSSFEVPTKGMVNAALSSFNDLMKKTGKTVSDYEAFISENRSVFGIRLTDEYASCDRDKLWELMKAGALYQTNTDVFKQFYSVLSILTMDRGSERGIADALGEYILFAGSDTRSAWEELDGSALRSIYSKLQNKRIDPSTFEREFKEMLVAEAFNHADRSNIREIMEKYASEIGLNTSASSAFGKLKDQSSVYVGMANRSNFGSYSEIKSAFDSLVSRAQKDESGGSSGGSGGGSASSGGSSGGAKVELGQSMGKNDPAQASPEPSVSPFTDLDEAVWAKDAIIYLYSKGIVNGVSATEFQPGNDVTREEFVKMLVLALNLFDATATCEFDDVDGSAWYAPYVASGVKNGIVMGMGDGRFDIGNRITRQDMAVMLFRVLERELPEHLGSADTEFSDRELIAPYAKTAIDSLSSAGIVNGVGDGRFAPRDYLTRAMAAAVIKRVIQK